MITVFDSDQTKRIRLLQEKQRIMKKLRESEVSATVSTSLSRENNLDLMNTRPDNESMYSWIGEAQSVSDFPGLTIPVSVPHIIFASSSAILSGDPADSWIPSFFKTSFHIKAKIVSVDKASFKVFTP